MTTTKTAIDDAIKATRARNAKHRAELAATEKIEIGMKVKPAGDGVGAYNQTRNWSDARGTVVACFTIGKEARCEVRWTSPAPYGGATIIPAHLLERA